MNALKVVLLLLVGALLYEGYETLFGSSPVDQIASLTDVSAVRWHERLCR